VIGKGKSTDHEHVELTHLVTQTTLLSYYLHVYSLPIVIKSPLRVDNHPSFGLKMTDGGSIYYKDFKTGDHGNIFSLLGKLWDMDIYDVVAKIIKDVPIIRDSNTPEVQINETTASIPGATNSNSQLACKIRSWKPYDIEYWEQYGCSLPWLQFAQIFPISHMIVTNSNGTFNIPTEKYAYVYVEFKDGIESLKFYQPYSVAHKWTNKHDASVWDLWEQLPPTGDKLIIASSRKDAVCVWENTGIPSCSLQTESYLPKSQVIDELKSRFKQIYVLYDNDYTKEVNYGKQYGQHLATEHNLIPLIIPTTYFSKDPSDLCKNKGRQKVNEVIWNLVNGISQTSEDIDTLPF